MALLTAIVPLGQSARLDLLAWLEEMDDLRYTHAEAAIVEMWSRVGEIPQELAARYLAILGSCYRSIGNLGFALECLEWAQERAGKDDEVVANVYQRLSYVLTYRGEIAEALGFAERACAFYVRLGNEPRIGQTLVDQAQCLIHLDELDRAEAALAMARRYIDESDRRNVFSIEQFSSTVAARRGNVETCLEHAQLARALAPDPIAEGKLLAAVGKSLKGLAEFAQAADAFDQVFEKVQCNPINALGATVDLADCLFRLLKSTKSAPKRRHLERRIRAVVDEARDLAAELRGNRVAQDAIDHLALAALTSDPRSLSAARRAAAACVRRQRRGDGLGDRVRRFRRLYRLSLDGLAAEAEVPVPTLRKIERGATPGTSYRPKLERWLLSRRPELSL